jgi:hypothetical protein
MKIIGFQVADPLDWGVRERPYLIVTLDERLEPPKRKMYGPYRVDQWGPFFEFKSLDATVGEFNTLGPEDHSPRLIEVQVKLKEFASVALLMDLKRARAELKKFQGAEQTWVLHLDETSTERTGGITYAPKRLLGNTCGEWIDVPGKRCRDTGNLDYKILNGVVVPMCPLHASAFSRAQYARRSMSA